MLLLFLLLFSMNSFAQRKDFAYNHSIDLQIGYAFSPSKVNGEAGTARAYRDGTSLDLRYSYFTGRHFGLFGQFAIANVSADDIHYFGALHKADGYKYKYASNSVYYDDDLLFPLFSIGPVYRIDSGGWSLRTRIGLGSGCYGTQKMSYAKYDFASSESSPIYIDKILSDRKIDYLVEDIYKERFHFIMSPSIQLKASLSYHFYLSLEAGAHVLFSTMTYDVFEYQAKPNNNPSTWPEDTYQSENIDSFTKDYNKCNQSTESFVPAPLFYCNFGIGWEIGKNKNARR